MERDAHAAYGTLRHRGGCLADRIGFRKSFRAIAYAIIGVGKIIRINNVGATLYGHADIADVAVIGVPDDRWGEAVKALIVLRPDRSADPAGILHFARKRLAGFKIPKSVEFVNELPRNPSGKILKRLLRERYWEGYERRVN